MQFQCPCIHDNLSSVTILLASPPTALDVTGVWEVTGRPSYVWSICGCWYDRPSDLRHALATLSRPAPISVSVCSPGLSRAGPGRAGRVRPGRAGAMNKPCRDGRSRSMSPAAAGSPSAATAPQTRRPVHTPTSFVTRSSHRPGCPVPLEEHHECFQNRRRDDPLKDEVNV